MQIYYATREDPDFDKPPQDVIKKNIEEYGFALVTEPDDVQAVDGLIVDMAGVAERHVERVTKAVGELGKRTLFLYGLEKTQSGPNRAAEAIREATDGLPNIKVFPTSVKANLAVGVFLHAHFIQPARLRPFLEAKLQGESPEAAAERLSADSAVASQEELF